MGNHAWRVCSIAYYHLRNISSIRKSLNHDFVVTLLRASVLCRLNYRTWWELLHKLQRVQIMSARMITETKQKRDHITLTLKRLHCLSMKQCTTFEVLPFTFKALIGAAPSYIRDLSKIHEGQQQLPSISKHILVVSKMAGNRTFIYQATTVWNALPDPWRLLQHSNVRQKTIHFSYLIHCNL